MVRAFENDTHPHVILFLDLSTSLTQTETTIALYQGACAALLKDGVRCTVRWYSEERSSSCSVSDPYQLHASLHQILAAPCAHSAHIPPQARSLGEGLYPVSYTHLLFHTAFPTVGKLCARCCFQCIQRTLILDGDHSAVCSPTGCLQPVTRYRVTSDDAYPNIQVFL